MLLREPRHDRFSTSTVGISRIPSASVEPLRVACSIALVGLVVLGGLAIYPTHSLTLFPDRQPQSSTSTGRNPPHYALGNVTLGPPGANPSAEVFDPQTGNLYVLAQPSLIKVISTRSNSVVATVDVGSPISGGVGTAALDTANGDLLLVTQNGETIVFSPNNNSVVRELRLGGDSIAYDHHANLLFVANFTSNNLSAINGTTLVPVVVIPIAFPIALSYDSTSGEVDVLSAGGFSGQVSVSAINDTNYSTAWSETISGPWQPAAPVQMASDPADGDLYVTFSTDYVLILNPTDGATVGTVPVGEFPWGLAYDSGTGTMFVANSQSANVSVIHGTSLRLASIPVGGGPSGVAYANDVGEVFVTNTDSDTVSVLNGSTGLGVATVVLGIAPDSIAYDSGTSRVFAVGGGSMAAISDSNHTPIGITSVGLYPEAVAYDSRTGNLYVADSDNNSVSVVSGTTHQVLTTVSVGSYPDGVAYDDRSGALLVACANANVIDVISDATNSLTATAYLGAMGAYPTGVVYDPTTNDAYVSDRYALSVISGATWQVIATLTSFSYSFVLFGYLALDSVNSNLYIPSYWGGVEVVSTATDSLVANITFVNGGGWYAAAFDAATGDVFVTNLAGNNVSVIDGADNAVIGNLTVGDYPSGIGYDNRTGEIYVANEYSDTLTYIVAVTPAPSPLGAVGWVVLGSTVTFGTVAVLVAVWIFQRSARSDVVWSSCPLAQ